MKIVNIFLELISVAAAVPRTVAEVESNTISHPPRDTALSCGKWATGSKSSAQSLQSQLMACDENLWGKTFTVRGTSDGKPGESSPCITLACDYVSAKVFHHTQISLCNDNKDSITKTCNDVATWAQRIIDKCCTSSSSDGLSGQIDLGDGTNIDISYSKACHSDERPDDSGPGMGHCVASQ